jgi:hypothetical protein
MNGTADALGSIPRPPGPIRTRLGQLEGKRDLIKKNRASKAAN